MVSWLFSRMEMQEHVRFSDATGPVADRTVAKNRWKLQAEEAMAEVRLVRVKPRCLLCVRPTFQFPQLPSMILSYQTKSVYISVLGAGRTPILALENLLVLVLFILSATACARHQQQRQQQLLQSTNHAWKSRCAFSAALDCIDKVLCALAQLTRLHYLPYIVSHHLFPRR